MTNPAVDALMMMAPVAQSTRRQRLLRGGAALFALIATIALLLSLYALYNTAKVAKCTNDNLGTRSIPTQRDSAAHIKFAKAIDALFLPPTATMPERQAAAVTFRGEVNTYVKTLVTDQADRAAHPLGKC